MELSRAPKEPLPLLTVTVSARSVNTPVIKTIAVHLDIVPKFARGCRATIIGFIINVDYPTAKELVPGPDNSRPRVLNPAHFPILRLSANFPSACREDFQRAGIRIPAGVKVGETGSES